MNYTEISMFILYLLFMLAIGLYFFFQSKSENEKGYFLGGRKMSAWVSGLSAGASDMSAWVLMGLPTSVYSLGLGQMWIPIGLALGYSASWIFMAGRLRKFSIVANDSITIPQYLTNRFATKSGLLQIICAVIFLLAYTVYCASSIKACGTLFHTVIGMNPLFAMYLAAVVIVSYTFLGGFKAVCWTDFFQALLILGAMLIAPIFATVLIKPEDFAQGDFFHGFFDPFANWKDIVSGLAWGLGYFGMPHIIIRFMSIESQKTVKRSALIGIMWTVLIVGFALFIGVIGRVFLGFDASIVDKELVFIQMVRKIFPALISGILLSAVLAASMSTADSQLLSAASSFAADVYKPFFRKNKISEKEMLWTCRIIVLVIAVIAVILAAAPSSGSIMNLVSNAWGLFGATFGPTILLSLFWRRFNYAGAVAGILSGAIIDMNWLAFNKHLPECCQGIYELLPGFVGSLIIAVIVSLITKRNTEAEDIFDKAIEYTEDE